MASPIPPSVRPLWRVDAVWVTSELERAWGSVYVARKGELLDASTLEGFVASVAGSDVGLLTVANRGPEYEVVSISTTLEGAGVGRALMQRGVQDARASGCRRIWLTTTNNNVRAFRFYQGLGMNLCAIYRDGVSASRQVKPAIPLEDEYGVPIVDELEFEILLKATK